MARLNNWVTSKGPNKAANRGSGNRGLTGLPSLGIMPGCILRTILPSFSVHLIWTRLNPSPTPDQAMSWQPDTHNPSPQTCLLLQGWACNPILSFCWKRGEASPAGRKAGSMVTGQCVAVAVPTSRKEEASTMLCMQVTGWGVSYR